MSPHKMYKHNCPTQGGEVVLLPRRTCPDCKQKGSVSWQSSVFERMAKYRRATGLPSTGSSTCFAPVHLVADCKACDGTGYQEIDDDEPHTCLECNGTGLSLTRSEEEMTVIRRWVAAAEDRLQDPAHRIILPPAGGALLEVSCSDRKPPAPRGGRLVLMRPDGNSASLAQTLLDWVNEADHQAKIGDQVSAVLLRCEPAVCDLFHEMAFAWSEAGLRLRVADGKILLGLPRHDAQPDSPGSALLALEPGIPARITLAWDVLRGRVMPEWLVEDYQGKVCEVVPVFEKGGWAVLLLKPLMTLQQALALLNAALYLINHAEGESGLLFSP